VTADVHDCLCRRRTDWIEIIARQCGGKITDQKLGLECDVGEVRGYDCDPEVGVDGGSSYTGDGV
jgi:hypothetical protein